MNSSRLFFLLAFVIWLAVSLDIAGAQNATQEKPGEPTREKIYVYVTDSQSWEIRGGWGVSGNRNADGSGSLSGGGYTAGGARPQTAEIIKTFNQRCPAVTVTNNIQRANFAVTLDHEGGKGYLRHRNKIVVFNRDGDAIFSDSTRELGNSVKDACQAILSAPLKPQVAASPTNQTQTTVPQRGTAATVANQSQLSVDVSIDITSTPPSADVELDGNFVGNTPSTIGVSPGDHTVGLKKNGYKLWERKIKVSSGKVNLSAELEPEVKQTVGVATTTTPESEESRQKAATASEHPAAPVAPVLRTVIAGTPENIGTVSFASEPSGAEVYVDDSFIGKTPATSNLKPGQHSVRMFASDYKNWSQQIMVVRGLELMLTAKLKKAD